MHTASHKIIVQRLKIVCQRKLNEFLRLFGLVPFMRTAFGVDGATSVKFDLILETAQNLPSATFALILFMSLSAALLINHILKVGVYTTLASIPSLLLAAIFTHSAFVAHNIYISPDKASNTAIAASAGFIMLAACVLLAYRIYAHLNDHR